MGLSASQARLLSLTARLSDLELHAQQISNSKIRLSMESTEASEEYLRALDKERLFIRTGVNRDGTPAEQDLSYFNLTGVDSPLLTQYGLSDRSGKLLVTQQEAAAFKQAHNGDEFCEIMGAPTTTTHSNNVVTISQVEYDAVKKAYEDSRKALNDYGSNNNSGSPHVKGYTADGNWQYEVPVASNVPTAYTDNQVFNQLNLTGKAYSNAWGGGSVPYASSSDTSSVLCFSKGDSFSSDLNSIIGSVTSDVSNALQSVLTKNNGSADYINKITQAVNNATVQTQTFYQGQLQKPVIISQDQVVKTDGGFILFTPYDIDNKTTIANTAGTNQIWDDKYGAQEYYIDLSQVVKTFLSYFDTEFAASNGASGNYTSQITDTGTNRTGGGQTYATLAVRTTENYNSVKDPDKIVYLTPNAGERPESVKATYEPLLAKYKATKEYYESFTITNVQKSAHTDYYMNIYNKMKADNYFCMDDEASTINEPAWTQNQILNNNLVLCKVVKDDKGKMVWEDALWQNNTDIEEKDDKRFIAQAEAKYNRTLADIQSKDKRFDLQLKQIDTEHQAIQATIDGVKKVIDKNIDRNLKMFQA